MGAIRLGLVFQMKERLGSVEVRTRIATTETFACLHDAWPLSVHVQYGALTFVTAPHPSMVVVVSSRGCRESHGHSLARCTMRVVRGMYRRAQKYSGYVSSFTMTDVAPRSHPLRPLPDRLSGSSITTLTGSIAAVCLAWSGQAREEELCQRGLRTLRSNPRIAILGDTGRKRLPIFSFLIRHGNR